MEQALVLDVQSVCFSIRKTNPPQLFVSAAGTVNSSGWSGGRLIPRVYIQPPEDGIQDLDFVATPPTGMVLWVVTPISASTSFNLEDWMKGVRIHASNGHAEALLEDESCAAELRSMA